MIVTDGAVDLPDGLEGSPLVRVVPGQVWLGDEPLIVEQDGFWALLRHGTYPSTTPPTVNALVEAYRHPDLVVAIHVSATLSATLERAQEAATRVGPAVEVLDTRSLSVGAGLVAAAVHHAAQNPANRGSIVDLARSLPDRLHTFALVQDIEALRRSNRVGLLPKGHLSRSHPLLLAVRGRAVPLEQPRDRHAALKCLIAHLRHSAGPELGAWALGHADASDREALVEQLSRALGRPPSFVALIDPTVGVHVGPESLIVGAFSGPIDL